MLPYRAAVRTIRPAELADVDAIARAHARAFFDDPLQVWALPDAGTRQNLLEQMFTLLLRVVCVPRGTTWTDAERVSAALWVPPGSWGATLTPEQGRELATLERALDAATLHRLGQINAVMHAAHPTPPHWYLQGLGTDPDFQRQGRASAVLTPVLELADASAAPAYLECTKATNVAFYESHGFAVTGTITVPDGGPTLWTMWREPRA